MSLVIGMSFSSFHTQHKLEAFEFTLVHICLRLSSWHTGAAALWVTGPGPLGDRVFPGHLRTSHMDHCLSLGHLKSYMHDLLSAPEQCSSVVS